MSGVSYNEGVQQGDPLGLLLFCLSIHLCSQLNAEFCCFYLDGGTIGGKVTDIIQDLNTVKSIAEDIGLQLNMAELICKVSTTY